MSLKQYPTLQDDNKFLQNGKVYGYPGKRQLSLHFLPLILLVVGVPTTTLGLLADIVLLVAGEKTFGFEEIAIAASCVLVLILPMMTINEHSKIILAEKGLFIQVFIFRYRWRFVAWEDIKGIKESPRPDRWWKPVWVIQVQHLTPWHYFISLAWAAGWFPGILITSDFEDQTELLEIVRDRIKRL